MNKDTPRILSIESRVAPGVVPDLTDRFKAPRGLQKLRPIQSWALAELARNRGLLAPIAVGCGKTIITYLAPTALGIDGDRALLLVPAALYKKTIFDFEQCAEHWHNNPPRVLAYEKLSRPESSRILDQDLDLIIADEAHKLRSKDSARTRRVARFFEAHPGAMFAAMSGTLTTRSIVDYAHLSAWALGQGSPLPLTWTGLESFAKVLDVSSFQFPAAQDIAVFEPIEIDPRFKTPARTKKGARRGAFHKRLVSAPGVVATTRPSVDCALTLERIELDPPAVILEALANLEATWETPGGEVQFADKMHLAACAKQITQGFYYIWDWIGLNPDRDWLEARAQWGRAVRGALKRNRPGEDSQALIAGLCEAGQAPTADTQRAWELWRTERHKSPPPVRAVWLSSYLLSSAWRWSRACGGAGLIWYSHRAVESRLRAAGIPTYGSGQEPPRDPTTCALSIAAHGTGRNLQKWARNLLLCCPRSGSTWEQLIGRTHRSGQLASTVECAWFGGLDPLDLSMEKATQDANYIEQTQGTRQKLLLARRTNTAKRGKVRT